MNVDRAFYALGYVSFLAYDVYDHHVVALYNPYVDIVDCRDVHTYHDVFHVFYRTFFHVYYYYVDYKSLDDDHNGHNVYSAYNDKNFVRGACSDAYTNEVLSTDDYADKPIDDVCGNPNGYKTVILSPLTNPDENGCNDKDDYAYRNKHAD